MLLLQKTMSLHIAQVFSSRYRPRAAFIFCLISAVFVVTSAVISQSPVSKTSPAGVIDYFFCAGTDKFLRWLVKVSNTTEGTPDVTEIAERGITENTTNPSPGNVQSILTVPATPENNGTTIRCQILSKNYTVTADSDRATLIVLSGILHTVLSTSKNNNKIIIITYAGTVNYPDNIQVANVNFDQSFKTVQWDPPPNSKGHFYQLTVSIKNQTIINNTTSTTNYSIESAIPFCEDITASVTVLHSNSTSVNVTVRTPGGDWFKLIVKIICISVSTCR